MYPTFNFEDYMLKEGEQNSIFLYFKINEKDDNFYNHVLKVFSNSFSLFFFLLKRGYF